MADDLDEDDRRGLALGEEKETNSSELWQTDGVW